MDDLQKDAPTLSYDNRQYFTVDNNGNLKPEAPQNYRILDGEVKKRPVKCPDILYVKEGHGRSYNKKEWEELKQKEVSRKEFLKALVGKGWLWGRKTS